MKKILVSSLLATLTTVPLSANTVDQTITNALIDQVVTCSGQLDLKIDGDMEGSIKSIIVGDSVSGQATVGLDSFMKIFPDKDKLAAYRIYTDCLSQQYSNAGSDKSVLSVGIMSRPQFGDLGNITGDRFELENFIEGRKTVDKYTFEVSRKCQFEISSNEKSQYALYANYRLTTSQGTEMGENRIDHRGSFTLYPGRYNLDVFLKSNKAGVYVADIAVNC